MAHRLASLNDRIAAVCTASGRIAADVAVLPVSKTFPIDAIRQAQALGLTRFGENRLQEVRQKAEAMGEQAPAWVVIGPVQTNKAKDVARWAAQLQTLDRIELAQALDRRLQSEGRALDVLIQVKTAIEPSKHGLAPSDLIAFLRDVARFDTLRVGGLMTVATQTEDPDAVRACFRTLRVLQGQAREAAIDRIDLSQLSMGMSGDFELAIAEGSTEVRIGSALFGDRDYSV